MAAGLEVLEDRSVAQLHQPQRHPRVLELQELVGRGRRRIDAQQAAHPQAESGHGERAIRSRPTQPPASWIVGRDIA
jgi:hypothetical protein